MSKGKNQRRRDARTAQSSAETNAEFDHARFIWEEEVFFRRLALRIGKKFAKTSEPEDETNSNERTLSFGKFMFWLGGIGIGAFFNNISTDSRVIWLTLYTTAAWGIWMVYRARPVFKIIFLVCLCFYFHYGNLLVEYKLKLAKDIDVSQKRVEEGVKFLVTKYSETTAKFRDEKATVDEQLKFYSLTALARKWQPPELPEAVPTSPDGLRLINFALGEGMMNSLWVGSEDVESASDRYRPIKINNNRLAFPYVKNNRVYVKTETIFGNTEETVKMNNEWPVTIPAGWDRNFNTNSFEIVDDTSLPVLQVRYNSDDDVSVNGIFVATNGDIAMFFGDYVKYSHPSHRISRENAGTFRVALPHGRDE